MTAFPSYSTGTVSIGAGATTVVGVGAIWSGVNARPGDTLVVAGHQVVIEDVTDALDLVIDAWPFTAVAAGTAYKIVQNSPLRFAGGQAMADVSALVAALNTDGFYIFVSSALTVPDPSYGNDGQYAFQASTGKLWIKISGAWSFLGVYKGFSFKGAYNPATAYGVNDVLTSGGSAYIVIALTTGNAPPNATYYSLLASKGDQGIQGVTGASYAATSATSFLIGTGSKAFTTQAGLAYVVGSRVRASSLAGGGANYMEGVASAYGGTTLTVNISKVVGSGTFADWQISLAGDPGSGDLLSTNNLSDLSNKATARANLGVDTGQCELIINKAVNIDQTWAGAAAFASGSNNPHPGASRGTETYGPDNWRLGANSGTGDFTGRRSNLPGTVPGIDNLLRLDVTTADVSATAGNNYHVEVPIEGPRLAQCLFGTVNAAPITIQFWFACSVNGIYALSLVEGTSDAYSCVKTFPYSGGGGAQQFFLTFPGDTTGTWSIAPATCGLKAIFDIGCGSARETSTVGSWQNGLLLRTASCTKLIANAAAVAYITGLQADVGSVALPYRWVDPVKDLLDCQRYYYKSFSQATAVAQSGGYTDAVTYVAKLAGVNGDGVQIKYPVSMQSSPVIVTFNPAGTNAKWRDQSTNADSGTPTIFNNGTEGLFLYNPQVAGDTSGSLQTIHFVANDRVGGH